MKKALWSLVVTCCLTIMPASFTEALADPVADAGPDQVVFDEVILDGSGSSDAGGTIVTYAWRLVHNENPAFNRTVEAPGPVVPIPNLVSGFYTVILTVINDAELEHSDVMNLAAAGEWVDLTVRVTDVVPSQVEPLDTITITGKNFGDFDPEASFVKIVNKNLEISSWSGTVIEAIIPDYKCGYFDGLDFKEKRLSVVVGDKESNKRKITINMPEICVTP
jgi:hypothetical protein